MSTAEIKKKLIDRIQSTSDQELLLEASRLLEIQIDDSPELFNLSSDMALSVEQSRQQIENGEYLKHKDANEEINKWFEK